VKKNTDPNLELAGADRVLKHVYTNLHAQPLLEIY